MPTLNANDQNIIGYRRPGQHPLRRGLLFVAIVWSIAGAFQLLMEGQVWLLLRAADSGWIPGEQVTPKSVQATDCSVVVQDVPRRTLDARASERARLTAYEMGWALGATTALRNIGVADSEQNRKSRSRPALELGVPAPEIPPLHSFAYALSEFETHIAADPQCTGALLAKFYSPQHDALYRFGAFVGHSVIYHVGVPQAGAMFVPYYRQYGKAAGLPEELWDSLIDAHADVVGAAGRLEAYLKAKATSEKH